MGGKLGSHESLVPNAISAKASPDNLMKLPSFLEGDDPVFSTGVLLEREDYD